VQAFGFRLSHFELSLKQGRKVKEHFSLFPPRELNRLKGKWRKSLISCLKLSIITIFMSPFG